MKIAILGGSFDPPHVGHIFIALQIKEILHLDQILFMPCFKHPFGKDLTTFHHRMAMLRLINADFFQVSDLEIRKKDKSFTINTLEELSKSHPQNNYSWIIGSDQIRGFSRWKNWQNIIKNYQLIIFPRETTSLNFKDEIKRAWSLKNIPPNVIILESKNLFTANISSSLIKQRIKAKKTIKHLVTAEVESYILKNKLYEK